MTFCVKYSEHAGLLLLLLLLYSWLMGDSECMEMTCGGMVPSVYI